MNRRTAIVVAACGLACGLLVGRIGPLVSSAQSRTTLQTPARGGPDWVARMADGWFKAFDFDHDGRLKAAEYDSSPGIVTKVGRWPFAQVDTNGDSQATPDEFRQAVSTYFRPRVAQLAADVLAYGDTDHDGRLDRAELARAVTGKVQPLLGFDLGDTDEAVAASDSDNDGRLSAAECETTIGAAFARHYTLHLPTEPLLRLELLDLYAADQEVRSGSQSRRGSRAAVTAAARRQDVDRRNTARLKAIVARYGWPTMALVGEDGAIAAWCLAQHADQDPAFQEQCLPLLETAARTGEARLVDVAYLTDRVLINAGKPQRYGTQCHRVAGELVPQPLEDPPHVDERRRRMGLGPLADYLQEMRSDSNR